MLFKNALIYQLTQPCQPFIDHLKANCEDNEFVPCAKVQALSIGLTQILPDVVDEMIVSLGEVTLFAVKRQEKKIPGQALREATDERVAEIEQQQSRKVYRKEKKALQEDIHAALLPQVLPVSHITRGYIDHKRHLVVIDSSSTSRAEEVLNYLRDVCGSFPVKPIGTNGHPGQVMTDWLRGTAIPGLSPVDEAKLFNPLDGGEAAVLKNTDLSSEAVQYMVESGWLVEYMRLQYQEIQFTLTDDAFKLKRIQWPDDIRDSDQTEDEDRLKLLEGDIHIMTQVVRSILDTLGKAFGGWVKQENLPLEEEKAA